LDRVLIISKETSKAAEMVSGLAQMGFDCSIIGSNEKLDEALAGLPDVNLALVDMNGTATSAWGMHMWEQIQDVKLRKQLPILAILSKETLSKFSSSLSIDDFVVESCDLSELAARVRRAISKTEVISGEDLIQCGDLAIDQTKCEVSVSGKLVPLAFREYELLKFLASNRGRVFTREALLNQVWGYDYYGGDRTVDVHIRRLRGKIEDLSHTFIETVRNIGYKFKENM
jgi:DNA-binding response OmpR family regulator